MKDHIIRGIDKREIKCSFLHQTRVHEGVRLKDHIIRGMDKREIRCFFLHQTRVHESLVR